MKLPNFAIIFIIIILPLSVVLSTYMQLQIDVLNAKENYSTKLLDATYDGILSFEINTLSIDNITGASVKSHVKDAVSTFFTTMSINMGESGASKTNVQSYVPAILFTTYDGYYIYSPVKTSQVQINEDTGIAAIDATTGDVIYEEKNGGDGVTAYKDGSKIEYDLTDASIDYNYMVKPFIYYSATYANNEDISNINFTGEKDYILTVNYSLDNHIALYGRYYDGENARLISKSGYLINLANTKIEISEDSQFFLLGSYDSGAGVEEAYPPAQEKFSIKYDTPELSEDDWINLFECYEANYQNGNVVVNDPNVPIDDIEHYKSGEFTAGGKRYIVRGPKLNNVGQVQEINNYTEMNEVDNKDQGGEAIIDYTLRLEEEMFKENTDKDKYDDAYIKLKVNGCEITDPDAKAYYLKAYFFSKWVEREFGKEGVGVQLDHIRTTYNNGDDDLWMESRILIDGQGIESYVSDELLFNLDNKYQDPEKDDSLFVQHKRQVIQNSIQYNLNSAISTYNAYYTGDDNGRNTDFRMPAFKPSDWEMILTRISMATFMQGVPCGTSTWGDYAIATSTNNKVFVNKANLYFISDIDKKNDLSSYYHSIDCNELKKEVEKVAETKNPPQTYAEMSHEYSYDAKDEEPLLYVVADGNKYKKYYNLQGEWYYWNGLKIPDTDTILGNLDSIAIKVESAYIDVKPEGKNIKQLMYCVPTGSSGMEYSYKFYKYGTHNQEGYLIEAEDIADESVNPSTSEESETSYEESVKEDMILYDHMNVDCYWCMMSTNYETFNFEKDYIDNGIWDNTADQAIATAWYTYIAKYRDNQFKMTDSIQR